jgi:hypothetical protein
LFHSAALATPASAARESAGNAMLDAASARLEPNAAAVIVGRRAFDEAKRRAPLQPARR